MRFASLFALLSTAISTINAVTPTIRINCGGGILTDSEGMTWSADAYYNKGKTSHSLSKSPYTSYRYDNGQLRPKPLSYTIPVSNGEYKVTLYFPAGLLTMPLMKRTFDVQLENKVAFTSASVRQGSTGRRDTFQVTTTVVTDGTLDIAFNAKVWQRVSIAAIVVEPMSVPKPTLAPMTRIAPRSFPVVAPSPVAVLAPTLPTPGQPAATSPKHAPQLPPMAPPKPTSRPLPKPTFRPLAKPTFRPLAKPTFRPLTKPTTKPTFRPLTKPTTKPLPKPTTKPLPKPTSQPLRKPTLRPTGIPLTRLTGKPQPSPAKKPQNVDAPRPASAQPQAQPQPTVLSPLTQPTRKPTLRPSKSQAKPSLPPVRSRSPALAPQQITKTLQPQLTRPATLSPSLKPQAKATNQPQSKQTLKPVTTVTVEPIRINAGGDEFTDLLGIKWQADAYFTGGQTYVNSAVAILNTQDDPLYQAERYGEFSYSIPLPEEGDYEITLLFAEIFHTAIGARVFDIEVEGEPLPDFANVDLVKQGGGVSFKKLTLTTVQKVADGVLNLAFKDNVPRIDGPKLSAIQIKLNAAHLAHADANGPYEAVDTKDVGSATIRLDSKGSHTHETQFSRTLKELVWTSDTGILGKGETLDVVFPVGEHAVTLTVTDEVGDVSKDSATVIIRASNFPFIASITPNSGPLVGGNEVTIVGSGFTASASDTIVQFGLNALTGSAITIVNPQTIKIKAPKVTIATPVSVTVKTPIGESSPMTYNYFGKSKIAFEEKKLLDFQQPTSVAFGPDGKLYVGSIDGKIAKITLDDEYRFVEGEVVSANVAPYRVILGMAFDPLDTSSNPTVYFTHWQFYHGEAKSTSGKAINGKVSRVSGANLDKVEDIVTGLPIADGDHGLSGLLFGDNGELYIQTSSNTNGGVPGATSQNQIQKENPLSAATLVAYLSRPNFNGFITYTADDDGEVKPGVDVEAFCFGTRNPVGLILHSNGNLYATDNGPDFTGDMAMGCNGEVIDDVEEEDKINLLVKGGYYGHPNMIRGKKDPRQCVWRSQNSASGNGFTAPLATPKSSTNGLIEFQSNHFDGQMRGDLIIAEYQGGVSRVILTPDGQGVEPEAKVPIPLLGMDRETGGLNSFVLVQHPDGSIVDARLDKNDLYHYRPIEAATTAVVIQSVFPRRGGLAGGSKLTIYGKNLNKNGNPTILVGTSNCNVVTTSPHKIVCTLPGGAGTVDVSLTTGSETSTFKRGYRFIPGV